MNRHDPVPSRAVGHTDARHGVPDNPFSRAMQSSPTLTDVAERNDVVALLTRETFDPLPASTTVEETQPVADRAPLRRERPREERILVTSAGSAGDLDLVTDVRRQVAEPRASRDLQVADTPTEHDDIGRVNYI